MLNSKRNSRVVNIFIILLAVVPAFALGDGNKNMLLVAAMCLSPYFLFRYPVIIGKIDIPLMLMGILMIFFPLLRHPDTVRWSTVLYSWLFLLYFMAYVRTLSASGYGMDNFSVVLKGLIYAYCIVLVIQQFCVLTGLPIFNESAYYTLAPWKLNSLTSEPSHSGRIIPILMYFYIMSRETSLGCKYVLKQRGREDRWVWIAFLWTVLTMGSATAFIFLLIIAFKLFPSLNWNSKVFAVIASVAVMAFLLNRASDNEHGISGQVDRAFSFVTTAITLDETKIIDADGSGAHRVVQSLRGAKFVGLKDADDWMGHGIDADTRLIPNWQSSELSGGAGLFQLWVNYGFIVSMMWWVFSFSIVFIKSNPWVSSFIWFISVFILGGLNNQILWLVLVLAYTYKTLKKYHKIKRNESNSYQIKQLNIISNMIK